MNGIAHAAGQSRSNLPASARAAGFDAVLDEAARSLERGDLDEAARWSGEVLAREAHNAKGLHLAGMIAYRRGEYSAAERWMRRAAARDRQNALYHSNLGGALQALGRWSEAVVRYRVALSLQPRMAEAHYNLANALRDLGEVDEAIAGYRRAIGCRPSLAEAHYNLANVLRERGMGANGNQEAGKEAGQEAVREAMEGYLATIRLRPDLSEAYTNLGAMLQQQNLLDASLACHRTALALAPERAENHYNLGGALCCMGAASEAMASYERAIELNPELADAHFGRSLVDLMEGEFCRGWQGYAYRWLSSHFDTRWRAYQQPVWDGGGLESGSLLVWKEQGVGDEIMFAGLVPELTDRGIRCVLECDMRLRPLFERSFPGVRVVTAGAVEELRGEIAAHLPIGGLPEILRRNAASFSRSRSPYLFTDPVVCEGFRRRYGKGPRVGLAWHTKNRTTGRRRSIDLEVVAQALAGATLAGAQAETQWISLQYGDHDVLEAEAVAAGFDLVVDRGVDQLEDMDTFAAQISALDLVITIDNSTAHLAGALGVLTWVLLPFAADWRWMRVCEDSPWYPAMRLFRQPRAGDWQSTLLQAREALAGFTLKR